MRIIQFGRRPAPQTFASGMLYPKRNFFRFFIISVWIHFENWSQQLTPEFFHTKSEEELAKPCNSTYSYKIQGLPSIKQHKILANRRHILVKYSNGRIAMFDVFTGQKCQTSFDCDWDEAIKQCERLLYVPNWFTGKSMSVRQTLQLFCHKSINHF